MSASPKKPPMLGSYRDQQFNGSMKEQEERLKTTMTLYIGNLSFFTTEDQIYHLFSKSGDVKRVVMGLDRFTKTPCGFCFVEYYTRQDAHDGMRYVNGTRLDERIIRCDWDAGFIEGRQYGRGKSGGQVRDEFRTDYDAGRGGFGKMIQTRVERFGPGGPMGPDGTPQRRFEPRGKRKWQEHEGGQNVSPDDLRHKLRRISAGERSGEVGDKQVAGESVSGNGDGKQDQDTQEKDGEQEKSSPVEGIAAESDGTETTVTEQSSSKADVLGAETDDVLLDDSLSNAEKQEDFADGDGDAMSALTEKDDEVDAEKMDET